MGGAASVDAVGSCAAAAPPPSMVSAGSGDSTAVKRSFATRVDDDVDVIKRRARPCTSTAAVSKSLTGDRPLAVNCSRSSLRAAGWVGVWSAVLIRRTGDFHARQSETTFCLVCPHRSKCGGSALF